MAPIWKGPDAKSKGEYEEKFFLSMVDEFTSLDTHAFLLAYI